MPASGSVEVVLGLSALLSVSAHGNTRDWPINPQLGVAGFPDCIRKHPELDLSMEDASFDLRCSQKATAPGAIKIACVGDSITAGVHSSGGNHTYPAQLQMLLDAEHGWGAYSVTNLGACGSTMLKKGDSPFWERPEYEALTNAKWDAVIIMLGTNDAKDLGSGGPNDWQHDCGGADATSLDGCSFATDYKAMVDVVRGLGTSDVPPQIYTMIAPPLMKQGDYGMNQTVINSVFPTLLPLIAKEKELLGPIDVFKGFGGISDWQAHFPEAGCVLDSTWQPCNWYCDEQSCDQCHPNNDGYKHMASVVFQALTLPPAPPSPPPSPSPPGAWLYEKEGSGRLFVPADEFTANDRSGRGGALAWDACSIGAIFDNGNPVWAGDSGSQVAVVIAAGSLTLRGSSTCGLSWDYPDMDVSYAFAADDGVRYEEFMYLEVDQGLDVVV